MRVVITSPDAYHNKRGALVHREFNGGVKILIDGESESRWFVDGQYKRDMEYIEALRPAAHNAGK